ncbi:MAG: hypothetical protein MMC23_010155 [Stictis urceolatum]|nr:hypothetical protein [Stictis urceolata]
MGDDEFRSMKRSRFDQIEPDPKRSSRFDRRSRSPSTRHLENRRSRSPISRSRDSAASSSVEVKSPPGQDPATAAAAAAARINAQIQAKKGIQHVDVPPIKPAPSPVGKSVSPGAHTSASSTNNINGEVYIADGDYIKDIEVNDLRNRYTLTKGSTQKTIKEETGADVTTRGNYYPDKSMATAANPPLYLHVTSTSKDGLEKAVQRIEELMKQELPNLVDERRFRRREPEQFERDELGRRKWPEERIPIELEPLPGFNLRAQVVGHGGAYVKHIQQETRCRVQIKGRGSGFMENGTGQESDEPMYLHVAGPDPREVQRAKELCEDLLGNVGEQYQRHKENPPQRAYGGSAYGDRHGASSYGGSTGYGGYGGGYGGYGGYGGQASPATLQSPTNPPGVGMSGSASPSADYTAQWQQYFAQNPQAYYYYQQQAVQQQQSIHGASNEQPPPPPPPSGSPQTGYNSVPPPPGM